MRCLKLDKSNLKTVVQFSVMRGIALVLFFLSGCASKTLELKAGCYYAVHPTGTIVYEYCPEYGEEPSPGLNHI